MSRAAGAVPSSTVRKVVESLERFIIELGAELGDDDALTGLKARAAAALLEQLNQPPSDLKCRMPRRLEALDVEAAIRFATCDGYEAAQRRCLELVAKALPELCTSYLRTR